MLDYDVFSDIVPESSDSDRTIRISLLGPLHPRTVQQVKADLHKHRWDVVPSRSRDSAEDFRETITERSCEELSCTLAVTRARGPDSIDDGQPYESIDYAHPTIPWRARFVSDNQVEFEFIGKSSPTASEVEAFLRQNHHHWRAVLVQRCAAIAYRAIGSRRRRGMFINSFRDLVSMPVGLEMKHVMSLATNYAVTPKADGERVLLIIPDGSRVFYRLHRGMICELMGVKRDVLDQEFTTGDFVLDCEWIESLQCAYVFDHSCWNGVRTSELPFRERRQMMMDQWTPVRQAVRLKHHAISTDSQTIWACCKTIINTSFPFRVDGLVFTPVNQPYMNRSIYKWKPVEETTVDGIITWAVPRDQKGAYPRSGTTLPFVLSGNASLKCRPAAGFGIKRFRRLKPVEWRADRRPMKILYPGGIDRFTVVECRYQGNYVWSVVRVREDKTRVLRAGLQQGKYVPAANHLWTAVSCWRSIARPVTLAILTSGTMPTDYYVTTKSSKNQYRPMVYRYHNMVKQSLIERFVKRGMNVLELAGGRGGDLMKLVKRRPRFVRFVDIDEAALREAKRRLTTSAGVVMRRKFEFIQQDLVDVTTPEWFVPATGPFAVVQMHFAVHYTFKSRSCLTHLVRRVESVTRVGSIWVMTTLDGDACAALLSSESVVNLGPFMLERLYEGAASPFGSAIRFSSQTIMPRVEYLVHRDTLEGELSNWTLVETRAFDAINVSKTPSFAQLPAGEQRYSALNRTYAFRRTT